MDIKDINNTAYQGLFTKNTAMSALAPMLGSGFANLLNQTSAVVENGEADIKVRPEAGRYSDAKKNEQIKDSGKTKAEASKDKAPADKADKKENAPVKDKKASSAEKNKKTKNASAETIEANAPAAPAQKSTPEKAVVESVAAGSAPAPVENADTSVEGVAPILEDISSSEPLRAVMTEANGHSTGFMENAFQAYGIDVVLADGFFSLSDPSMSIENLISMPEVKVLMADGSVETMSGAELAAQIQSSGETPALQEVPFLQALNDVKIPSEVMDEAVRLSEASRSASETAFSGEVVQNVVYADENLALQAALLDEKISSDKPVKVSVDVKEEKNSLAADDSLIQNTVDLADAIQAAADIDAETAVGHKELKMPDHVVRLVQAENSNASVQNVNYNANAFAAVNNVVMAAEAVEAAAPKLGGEINVVSSVASTNAAHSAVMGNEFAQVAKNEAGSHPAETSLRDVYKGMSKEAVEQVKVNITKSAVKGVDKIDIQLKPEDLGHIQIKMQIKDGKLQAHIVASRPETADMLQKEVQSLEKAFNDAGFETDEGSLTFSFSEGNQAGHESEDNTKLRHFIGEVLDGETSEDMANDNWTYSNGLNIRV